MKHILYSVFITSVLMTSLANAETVTTAAGANMSLATQATTLSTPVPTLACLKFTRGLGYGSRGTEVSVLQTILIEKGYLNAEATGFFGTLTKNALMKYQKAGGISATGYFGEKSRGFANDACTTGANPSKPSGTICSMEARLCSDGTLMERDASCTWHPEMCKTTPTPPCSGLTCKPTGIMCTMEARLCDDGSAMPRDAKCGWHPELCKAPPIVACTMEARLCSDGTMMPRDAKCGWHPELCKMPPVCAGGSCPPATSTNQVPLPGVATSTCAGATCKPTGIMCTMEARLCSDGTMMPRDAMCSWHPEMCKMPPICLGATCGGATSTKPGVPTPSVPPAPSL